LGLLSGFFFSKRDFIELETHGVLQRTIKISTISPSRSQVALKQANNPYLVLSDMHFGTQESSVNDARFREAMIDYMVSRAPWEEIVFIGDLLDVNLSTLTRAIEGGTWPDLDVPLFGFRQFVKELHTRMRRQASDKELKDLTKKWIYVPGNHDYKVWDMLSSKVICEDVLASGKQMSSVPTPLMMGKWTGDESFFAGIFRPYCAQGQVVVEYPNHEILFGQEPEKMVLTHGHYLDAKQTRFNDLSDHFRNSKTPEEIRKVRRTIFIETAQYQTVANAISFTMGMRGLVNVIVGPDAFGNKIKKVYNQIGSRLLSLFFPTEGRKGKSLSPKQLLNMEYYLEQFCQDVKLPRWFIFGHTHHQGRKTVGSIGVEVYNAGSCYIDRGMPITFIEVETDADGMPIIQLMCVDQGGKVKKTHFSE
jgi:UDP-2,3-diacylglucosamine pyrophosphatase LpxH